MQCVRRDLLSRSMKKNALHCNRRIKLEYMERKEKGATSFKRKVQNGSRPACDRDISYGVTRNLV